VSTVKSSLLMAVLLAACAAQTQTLRIVPVHLDAVVAFPKTVGFFCTQNYRQQACVKDAITLRFVLTPYPLERAGTWSFVLVPADDWKALLPSTGDPVSPAFSIIEQRTTVLESSLFSPSPSRGEEFLKRFGKIGAALQDLAVTHELGHAICQDTNERHADDFGRGLREKKPVACANTPRRMSAQGTAR
jgi:hypothetical protein